jgi:hypothetical protein
MAMKSLLAIALLSIASCRQASDATSPLRSGPPAAQQNRLVVKALDDFRNDCRRPGEVISLGPEVMVTDAAGFPRANEAVTFTADNGGTIEHPTVVTNYYGVARAGAWTLGAIAGENIVTARLSDGGGGVTFATVSRSAPLGHVMARLDLFAVDGHSLPVPARNGSAITSGHS